MISLQLSVAVASNSNVNSQTTINNPLQSSPTPYTFTSFVNTTSNEVHLFTATMNSNTSVLTDYTFGNAYALYGEANTSIFNLDLSHFNNTITKLYYYNSGQHRFYIMSRNVNSYNKSFEIYVDNFNNSNSYNLSGNFHFLTVHQFLGSNDVYFILYNSSNLLILQYVNSLNQFTIFFENTNNNPIGNQIQQADAFTYDNELYICYYYAYTTYTYTTYNSTVLTFNSTVNNPIFNKTFDSKAITSVTPIDDGLLLYSQTYNTFYKFNYIQNSIVSQSSYAYGNQIFSIRPFNNNTFLVIQYKELSIFDFSQYASQSFSLVPRYYYYLNNYNSNYEGTIQAFNISSNYEYLLNTNYNNKYYLTLNSIAVNPVDSGPSTVTVTQGNNYYNPPQTITTTVTSSSSAGVLFILLIIIIAVGGIIVYAVKNNNQSQNYQPRNVSYLNNSVGRNQRPYIRVSNTCYSCHSAVGQDDVFCQNCGSRVK